MVGKQTGGMAVFADTEQNQIKLRNIFYGGGVLSDSFWLWVFAGDVVYLRSGNRDMRQPRINSHFVIAAFSVGRQAAFVTKINMPVRPIGFYITQQNIEIARRVAAR